MPNPPGGSDGRRFTDGEMKLILERAGEADAAARREAGYSLAEIQEIAQQVGLNPTDVAKAASTLRGALDNNNPVLGAPIRFHATRTLPTRLGEDDIADIVRRVREITGARGEVRSVPGGVEWRARPATGHFAIDFTPRGDGTRVDLTIVRAEEAILTSMVAVVVGAVAGFATGFAIDTVINLDGAPEVLLGMGSMAVGAFASMRLAWALAARRWTKRTDAVMDAISETAAERGTQSDDAHG